MHLSTAFVAFFVTLAIVSPALSSPLPQDTAAAPPAPPPPPPPPAPPTTATPPQGNAGATAGPGDAKPGEKQKVVDAKVADQVTPPPIKVETDELASVLTSITMSNKVGGIPQHCKQAKAHDVLVCNLPSMLTEAKIQAGIATVRQQGMQDFSHIGYVEGHNKKKAIQWGSCRKAGGMSSDWEASIALTRIFGGMSCVKVFLSEPPKEMEIKLKATEMALKQVLDKQMGNDRPAVNGKAPDPAAAATPAAPAATPAPPTPPPAAK